MGVNADGTFAVKKGDVIQIRPSLDVKEPFHCKLAIVDEVKAWGVVAYIDSFQGAAWVRLIWTSFDVIGEAVFVQGNERAAAAPGA